MEYRDVLREVESWPVGDRIRLLHEVGDGILDRGQEPELGPELKAELDRRIAELDRNPDLGLPWKEAKVRILKRISALEQP
jgi:putative addiction module component (TIGR02574 family)